MDSYNFHFERMSNLDLHPLSLPVSRLSPAKSSSSIVDQLAHHQRGKGDSAYSSFSGGSTAQDYQSPFLGDELQPCSLHHYADYKYVKAIYQPAQVLRSDPKTMDRLYRSVEAISQQYRHNGSSHGDDGGHSHGGARQSKTKPPGNQEVPPRVAPPPPALPPPPPPPPARLDSFIATRNLENSWLHQQGADSHAIYLTMSSSEIPAPQPEAQPAPRPHAKPPPWDRSLYGAWRGQHQQLPVYRPHLQTPEPPGAGDDPPAAGEPVPQHQSPPANAFSHPPPRGRSLTEQHKHKQPAAATPEGQQIGVRSANEVAEPARSASPWSPSSPNAVNGSIQHKGQFYFVTGVCAPGETGARMRSLSSCATEAPPEPPCTPREHVKVKQRCYSTMEQLPGQHGPPKPSPSWEGLLSRSSPEENVDTPSRRPQINFSASSRSLDPLEQPRLAQSGEAGRHTPNHPIFYCGPKNSEELPHLQEQEEQAHRGSRQPLGDLASDRINKETTPLLYHLTGASRAALNPQIKDTDVGAKGKDARIGEKAVDVAGGDRSPPATSHQEDVPLTTQACNAPDDSFTKYYKEKLKDAQRKVLRETSFKRKDLQLSWPHRVRPKPEPRATAIHSFASSRDSEVSTDAVTPPLASEEPERRAVKEDHPDRDGEGETGRPVNVAQPQVARVGGRKRISAEQKKLCYSEPEKLNQLGTYPQHSPCRSLGNEADAAAADSDDSDFFAVERGRGEPWLQGEQGLVASRRKMFETRGRALSTSSLCKTSLKHIQHKALVEYMERKTGQKVAEPLKPQLTAPPRQRLSLGEKPFDLVYKPQAGSTVNKTHKKKLSRPHSAGRILDSSTSSIRYAQFFSVHTGSVHCGSQPLQQNCQKKQRASQGKCASVENLLDQGEPPCILRTRSTSIPPEFQAHVLEKDTPAAQETCSDSLQKNPEEPSERIPDGQQRTQAVRVTAQRGKSMEELGVWKLPRPTALSKSSEQLDQLRSPRRAPESEGTVSSTSLWEKARQGKDLWGSVRTRPELEPVNQDDSLALGPPKCQQQSLSEQDLAQLPVSEAEAELPTHAETRDLSRTGSPATSSSSRVRAHSGSPGVCGSVTEEVRVKRPSSDSSNPPSPRGQKTSEWEVKCTSSTPSFPVHKESPINIRPNSRVRTCPDASTPGRGQVMDEPGGDSTHSSDHDPEVSLSCGVAMDTPQQTPPIQRALSEEGRVSPLAVEDEVFTDESPTLLDAPLPTSADPGNAPEGGSETADAEEMPEERGSPEGETESPLQPTERPQWAELVEAVAGADRSLAAVFYPLTNRKTALMLMEQLLSEDTLLMEEHYKKKQRHEEPAQSAETVEDGKPTSCISALDSQAPPARLARVQNALSTVDQHTDAEEKHLLVSVIEEHLRTLEETHGRLQVEVLENASRGAAVQGLVRERCPPVELERYNLFIGDLERVVSLLLCLSARLARVQNALSTVDQHTDAEEKQSLDSRHHLLCKQREDAKDLKDNLDRRESVVATFLARQLSAGELGDYRRFIQTKASLLIRQKDLEERQRLREEQLEALRNSLPP